MADFPPPTHVTLTRPNLSVSIPAYGVFFQAEPVLDEDRDDGFHMPSTWLAKASGRTMRHGGVEGTTPDKPKEGGMLDSRRGLFRASVAFFVAATMMLIAAGVAQASTTIHIVATFDESGGQNTEGVAVDRTGNVFVSVSPLGDVWKFPSGSTTPEPFGHIDGITAGTDFGLLGLAADVDGNVYGAVQSANQSANGIWRFDAATGDATHIAGTEAMAIPNGLTFDHADNLFVADSSGKIWRIRPSGKVKVWLDDPALTGDGSLGLFLGANGIAYRDHVFTVTNTERRTILTIPKLQNGGPGPIDVLTTLPAGDNPDGVALDVEGNAYVAFNLANTIGLVSPSGSLTVLASGDPLDFPSSLAFDQQSEHRRMLFGVNFSLSEFFGLPSGFGPALWWLRAGARGVRPS
jgi:outer membrane protein assembly factor BamB